MRQGRIDEIEANSQIPGRFDSEWLKAIGELVAEVRESAALRGELQNLVAELRGERGLRFDLPLATNVTWERDAAYRDIARVIEDLLLTKPDG